MNGSKIPLDFKSRFNYFVKVNWGHPKSINEWGNYLSLDLKVIKKWAKNNDLQETNNGLIFSNLNFKKTQDKISLFFKRQYDSNPYRSVLSTDTIVSSLKISNKWFSYVMNKLIDNNLFIGYNGGFSAKDYIFEPNKKDQDKLKEIKKMFIKSGYAPISSKQILSDFKIKPNHLSGLLYVMESKNDIENIGNDIYIYSKSLKAILHKIKLFFSKRETMSVAQFKNITDLSRKGAIPLLEFLDKNSYTTRLESERIAGELLND